MATNQSQKPTTVHVDSLMSEESLLLLFSIARDAILRNEPVEIHIATSYQATKDEFEKLVQAARNTSLPDRIIRRTSIYIKHYNGGYIREVLRQNLLWAEDYDRGMGHLQGQYAPCVLRWVLDLDNKIQLEDLMPLLSVFPYFSDSTGSFVLFVNGKNAKDIIDEYQSDGIHNTYESTMPQLYLFEN